MDFLKDIVKEIGDDFTKLAADIDETETYVDTGSFIFNATKSLQLLVKVLQEKLSSLSQWLRIFWTLILMDIACILILRQLSISHS
jgi:hypothetical protein